MDKEQFENIVEDAMTVASNDVEKHSQIEDRKLAIDNLKKVSDIWLDYQKAEYTHEENMTRLENDRIKTLNDNDFRIVQIESENNKSQKETMLKIALFTVKTIILIGGIVSAHKFETGGTFTSTLGRAIFPSMGKSLVDDVVKY